MADYEGIIELYLRFPENSNIAITGTLAYSQGNLVLVQRVSFTDNGRKYLSTITIMERRLRFLWVLATLPVNLQKWVFVCQRCHQPKKSGSLPTKLVGEVNLHCKISDFSVQNRNYIAKMTTIWP